MKRVLICMVLALCLPTIAFAATARWAELPQNPRVGERLELTLEVVAP